MGDADFFRTPLQAHQDLVMCGQIIVDRVKLFAAAGLDDHADRDVLARPAGAGTHAVFAHVVAMATDCLLYTSDAADDLLQV